MSRTSYDIQASYVGTGSVSAYAFTFKIEELAQLLIVERDAAGLETQRVRGTDVTYLSSVVFDAEAGAGTVNLAANLASSYKLDIFLANDAPTQPKLFKNRFDFNMKNIENALDFVLGPVQRALFLVTRSVKLKDYETLSNFDVELPVGIVGTVEKVLGTNAAGDGLALGPTFTTINDAVGYAAAAAVSAAAALASQIASAASAAASAASAAASAASAVAAAASAATALASAPPGVETAITDGLGAATIDDGVTNYTFLPGTTEAVHIDFSIYRGTTVVGTGVVEMVYDGSAWNLFETSYYYPGTKSPLHGLTFSLSGNELQVAADSGAGAGKLFTKAFQS